MRSYMYYHEIMETEILPQYLSLKVGAYDINCLAIYINDINSYLI